MNDEYLISTVLNISALSAVHISFCVYYTGDKFSCLPKELCSSSHNSKDQTDRREDSCFLPHPLTEQLLQRGLRSTNCVTGQDYYLRAVVLRLAAEAG